MILVVIVKNFQLWIFLPGTWVYNTSPSEILIGAGNVSWQTLPEFYGISNNLIITNQVMKI
jgi:hypothetical protein